jgi:serine/threonine-protein kinase
MTPTTFQLGQRVGAAAHLELIEELGQGGMGKVYLARQADLDRLVALKVLHGPLANDKEYLGRFQREAKLAAKLDHKHVVKVYEAGRDRDTGAHYIAFEYLPGGSLEDRAAPGPLSEVETLEAGLGIARALQHAELHALVHRDVKPENVLYDAAGTVKLADLGLCRVVGDDTVTRLTATGVVVGTPYYMAPEVLLGKPADARTDVFALGLSLWRCLTGARPLSTGPSSLLELMTRRIHEDVPDVREHAPDVSEEAAELIAKLTVRDPDGRFTPNEAVGALRFTLAALRKRPS